MSLTPASLHTVPPAAYVLRGFASTFFRETRSPPEFQCTLLRAFAQPQTATRLQHCPPTFNSISKIFIGKADRSTLAKKNERRRRRKNGGPNIFIVLGLQRKFDNFETFPKYLPLPLLPRDGSKLGELRLAAQPGMGI